MIKDKPPKKKKSHIGMLLHDFQVKKKGSVVILIYHFDRNSHVTGRILRQKSCDLWTFQVWDFTTYWLGESYSHDGSGSVCHIWQHWPSTKTPVLLAYIPYIRILWDVFYCWKPHISVSLWIYKGSWKARKTMFFRVFVLAQNIFFFLLSLAKSHFNLKIPMIFRKKSCSGW